MPAKATLYLDQVSIRIDNATVEVMSALALQMEAYTKINITDNDQIDTGFMRASAFAIFPDGDNFGNASSEAGGLADRPISQAPQKPGGDQIISGVCVGAHYAIYQEERNSFLYRAGQQTAEIAGSIATPIYQAL